MASVMAASPLHDHMHLMRNRSARLQRSKHVAPRRLRPFILLCLRVSQATSKDLRQEQYRIAGPTLAPHPYRHRIPQPISMYAKQSLSNLLYSQLNRLRDLSWMRVQGLRVLEQMATVSRVPHSDKLSILASTCSAFTSRSLCFVWRSEWCKPEALFSIPQWPDQPRSSTCCYTWSLCSIRGEQVTHEWLHYKAFATRSPIHAHSISPTVS